VGDRQLAKEILYDMKESEAAAKAAASSVAAAVAQAATPAPGSAVLRTPASRQPTTGAAATTLPSGATAATPLAATVLRASAPRTGVAAVSALRLGTAGKLRTPFAPPSVGGATATTPAAAVAASTEPFDSQVRIHCKYYVDNTYLYGLSLPSCLCFHPFFPARVDLIEVCFHWGYSTFGLVAMLVSVY
jgi:hypothetical protein